MDNNMDGRWFSFWLVELCLGHVLGGGPGTWRRSGAGGHCAGDGDGDGRGTLCKHMDTEEDDAQATEICKGVPEFVQTIVRLV